MSSPTLAAVDFGQGLTNAWNSIATFVPKLLAFLVVFLIGWLIAKAIGKGIGKLLGRVGFDRVADRVGFSRMLARSNYSATDIIAKIIYYMLLLVVLQIAFSVWGPNAVSDVLTGFVAWLPQAVVAIVIIVVAGAIARAVKDLVSNMLGSLSYGPLLGTLASVFVWGLGIIAALNQIGVATAVTLPVLITVLATIGGIAIVGVGGGLVRPMQARWDRWLNRAEDEIPQAKAQADAYQRGREDADRTATPPTGQQVPASPAQPGVHATPGGPTTQMHPPGTGYPQGPPRNY